MSADILLKTDQTPPFPKEGAKKPDMALAYIAEYFPQVLSGPNTIGTELSSDPTLEVLPKTELQSYERFISKAGPHELRYFISQHASEKWHLQYTLSQTSIFRGGGNRSKFFLQWEGKVGSGSGGVYGNFVDQIDFEFDAQKRLFCAGSMSGGYWSLKESIDSDGFPQKLQEVSEASYQQRLRLLNPNIYKTDKEGAKGLVKISNAFTKKDNILVLNIEDGQGEGQISFPSTVTPRRFK